MATDEHDRAEDRARCRAVARLVRAEKPRILAEWTAIVRADPTIPRAREISDEALLDHAPVLLDELAAALEGHDAPAERVDAAARHGAERAGLGYTIRSVIREMTVMRDLLERAAEDAGIDVGGAAGSTFRAVLDDSLASSVEAMEAESRGAIERQRDEARRERERATQLAAEKDLYLAVIAHEIRNPLNAMLGWLALARDRIRGDALLGRAIDTLDRNVAIQRRLVEDLLDLERARRGKLALDTRPLDLARLVDAAVESARPEAAARCLDLSADTRDALPVVADAERMLQVLSNLISNALKYTSERGRVAVRASSDGDRVRVEVHDDGAGIDPAMQTSIFEPFRQADPLAGRRRGGIGVGLAIVREVVEAHGGRVGVQSEGLGRGSTFWLELPRTGAGH